MTGGLDDDLALALRLADAADAITLARYRERDLRVEQKPDLTPVTDADRGAETELRRLIERDRPGDPVLGEEFGMRGDAGARRWILDPIDGTKNFVRGVPVWATLIALECDGRPAVGVASAPALGRRWWAARGLGAWTSGPHEDVRRCAVSGVDALGAASMAYSSIVSWEVAGRLDGFLALARTLWRTRAYGDFWAHLLVAEGAVDIACEPEVSLWDLAALQVIVEEAGGRLTDLSGAPRADGGSVVCSNGRLHDEVLAFLDGRSP